jgi:hypothetical protein
MIGALIYLQVQSLKNRLRARLRRLKKPKYLAGAAVGAAYFYFFFFRHFFAGRRPATGVAPETLVLFELLGALVLFAMVLSAWIFPHERAALAFTEAEIAFLFPAPVTRRTLIHFKLLRSQIAILFTTLLLTLVTRRFGGGGAAWIRAFGWWLILSTLNLHTLAASFARTRLLDRGISNWRRRTFVLSAATALVVAAALWFRYKVPAPQASDFESLETIKYYFRHALESGPAFYMLYPFRMVVRPYLALDGWTFLFASGPVFALMLLHYWWVVKSDVAFEEASVDYSRKLAEKIAVARAGGGWHSAARKAKKKRPPFALRPIGLAPIGFLWKNLISAGQTFTLRSWVLLAFVAICIGGLAGASRRTPEWLPPTVGIVTAILAGYSLLLGPAIMRQDLRQDLVNADVLKMYPLRGWQIVLGELLAPTAILTGAQWCLLLLAATMFSQTPGGGSIPLASRLSIGVGAAIIAPTLNLISLIIPNASVLLFPSWVQTGRERGGGIEVMGQRLIFMLGSVLVFAFALVPAAALFALVLFAAKIFISITAAVPLAAAFAAAVMAAEAALAVWWMGRLFERFDLSAESLN